MSILFLSELSRSIDIKSAINEKDMAPFSIIRYIRTGIKQQTWRAIHSSDLLGGGLCLQRIIPVQRVSLYILFAVCAKSRIHEAMRMLHAFPSTLNVLSALGRVSPLVILAFG